MEHEPTGIKRTYRLSESEAVGELDGKGVAQESSARLEANEGSRGLNGGKLRICTIRCEEYRLFATDGVDLDEERGFRVQAKRYLVYSRQFAVEPDDGASCGSTGAHGSHTEISIAFPLDLEVGDASGQGASLDVEGSVFPADEVAADVFAFLPVRRVGLPFLLHADWRVGTPLLEQTIHTES